MFPKKPIILSRKPINRPNQSASRITITLNNPDESMNVTQELDLNPIESIIIEQARLKDSRPDRNNKVHMLKNKIKQELHEGQQITDYQQLTDSFKKALHFTPDTRDQTNQGTIQQNTAIKYITSFQSHLQDSEIEPVFRYCFCCENLVLEKNMDQHQLKCHNFSQLYQQSPEDILKLLLSKINRIKEELIDNLNNREGISLIGIDEKMVKLIRSTDQAERGNLLSSEFDESYKEIKQIFGCRELKMMQLSYKLNWFMKIREQFKKRFGL